MPKAKLNHGARGRVVEQVGKRSRDDADIVRVDARKDIDPDEGLGVISECALNGITLVGDGAVGTENRDALNRPLHQDTESGFALTQRRMRLAVFEFGDDQCGEVTHRHDLVIRPSAGNGIDDTQRSNRSSSARSQRDAQPRSDGSRPNGTVGTDQWMRSAIVDDHWPFLRDDVLAHGMDNRGRLLSLEPGVNAGCRENDRPIPIDDGDQRNGSSDDPSGQARESVDGLVSGRGESLELVTVF